MYRLTIKLDSHIYQGPLDYYGFHLARWRVLECKRNVHNSTAPVKLRHGWPGHNRLMLLSPTQVEPGEVVQPYWILQAYLASRSASRIASPA